MAANGAAPKRVQAEVRSLSGGRSITPEQLVEWAKANPRSALYSQFEWDDTEAGRLYRLEQASRIIRLCVTVVKMPQTKTRVTVRAFASLSTDRTGAGVYRPMVKVLANSKQRHTLLQDALAELEALQRKYAALSELSSVWAAVSAVRVKALGKSK